MDSGKLGLRILLIAVTALLAAGAALCSLYVWYVELNITVDYPKKYEKDLDRVLGPGWRVRGTEYGYVSRRRDRINIISWNIAYEDQEGQEQTLLLSNFYDRSYYGGFGYCLEKNFEELAAQHYIDEVISPILPAVIPEPGRWFWEEVCYVSGDNVCSGASQSFDGEPLYAYVNLDSGTDTYPSPKCRVWEDPQEGLTLWDADFSGIFKRRPDEWYLTVQIFMKAREKEEAEAVAGKVLEALNGYTDSTINVHICVCRMDEEQTAQEYCHWYVVGGELTEEAVRTVEEEYKSRDNMYWRIQGDSF